MLEQWESAWEHKEKAKECICTFIKKIYLILNTIYMKPELDVPKSTE